MVVLIVAGVIALFGIGCLAASVAVCQASHYFKNIE
jgi:hypothetical protein